MIHILNNVEGKGRGVARLLKRRGLGARPNWVNSDEGLAGDIFAGAINSRQASCPSFSPAASLLLLPPSIPSPPPSFFACHGPRLAPGLVVAHDEDDEARSPILKSTIISLLFLPSRSRPSKDTLDLFATLIVSLQLTTHKQFFRTFPNSFTTCVCRWIYPYSAYTCAIATRRR